MERIWDSEMYERALKIARGLTDKGIRIGLNQKPELKPEYVEAFEDTLRERGAL